MGNKSKEENVEQEQPSFKSKAGKVFNVVKITWKVIEKLIMFIIVFISLIIVTQRVTDNDKAFLGFRIFRVETGSMIPVYNVGDVILVKQTDTNKIKIGEDVTYWGTTGSMKGRIVTHRVIDIEEQNGEKVFHTQGVANNAKDPLVNANQINGVVQGKLHIITSITSLLNNPYGFYFVGIIPLTIIIFFSVMKSKLDSYKKYEK